MTPFWPLEFGGGSWIFVKFCDWRKQRRAICGIVKKKRDKGVGGKRKKKGRRQQKKEEEIR